VKIAQVDKKVSAPESEFMGGRLVKEVRMLEENDDCHEANETSEPKQGGVELFAVVNEKIADQDYSNPG
jgi:hypothetical protein